MPRPAPLIVFILRVAAGFVFAFSGWHKLIRPVEEFHYVIEQYQILSLALAGMIANILPWGELVFGFFLILGFLRRASAVVLAALASGFIFFLSSVILRHVPLSDCGCFGAGLHL